MKKLAKYLSLSVILMMSLAGCGNTDNNSSHGTSGTSTSNSEDNKNYKKDKYDKDGRLIVSFFGIDLDNLQSQTEDTKKSWK